jgi:hypothetical protein
VGPRLDEHDRPQAEERIKNIIHRKLFIVSSCSFLNDIAIILFP